MLYSEVEDSVVSVRSEGKVKELSLPQEDPDSFMTVPATLLQTSMLLKMQIK